MRRLCEALQSSPNLDNPLTNYDFALARRQALMLVAGQAAITAVVALVCAASISAAGGHRGGDRRRHRHGGEPGAGASGFRRGTAGDAKAIARGFYRGEALKIAVTVVLFVLALRGRHFTPGPMLAGYVATFVAYWVALARTLRAG